jgi:hypothetical protein
MKTLQLTGPVNGPGFSFPQRDEHNVYLPPAPAIAACS